VILLLVFDIVSNSGQQTSFGKYRTTLGQKVIVSLNAVLTVVQFSIDKHLPVTVLFAI